MSEMTIALGLFITPLHGHLAIVFHPLNIVKTISAP